jgi:signal transduction histidine kinase
MHVAHPDEVERCRELFVTASAQRRPFQLEQRFRRRDGEYRWVVNGGVPRRHVDGSFAGYIGTAIDITERKLAERAMSTISQRLIEAQEDERARIARELHDDVNQRLAMLSWRLNGLVSDPAVSRTHMRKQITQAREEASRLMTDVQALSHRLHPSRLELLGLAESAAALCREISEHQSVAIHFQSERVPQDLSLRLSLCLYRVLQEALQNVVKHSGAAGVEVRLLGAVDRLELTVEDDGGGFDLDAIHGSGLGLTSMKERLKAVGGHLVIHSAPESGTSIRAYVPFER